MLLKTHGCTFELVAYSTSRQGVDCQYFAEESSGALELRQPVAGQPLKSVCVPGCLSMQRGSLAGGRAAAAGGRGGAGASGAAAATANEALIAALLTQRAMSLSERSQAEGVTAFLRRPAVRGRLNERFLQNTLRDVRTSNRRAEEAELWELREAQLEREARQAGRAQAGNRDGQSSRGTRDWEDAGRSGSAVATVEAQGGSAGHGVGAEGDGDDGGDDGPYMMTDEEIEAMLARHRVRGRGGVGSKADAVGPQPLDEGGEGQDAADDGRWVDGRGQEARRAMSMVKLQMFARLGLPVPPQPGALALAALRGGLDLKEYGGGGGGVGDSVSRYQFLTFAHFLASGKYQFVTEHTGSKGYLFYNHDRPAEREHAHLQLPDVDGESNVDLYYHYTAFGSPRRLQHVMKWVEEKGVKPSLIIFNVCSHYLVGDEQGFARDAIRSLEWAAKHLGSRKRVVWRSCTTTKEPLRAGIDRAEANILAYARKAGFSVYDTRTVAMAGVDQGLMTTWSKETVHFNQFMYEQFNDVLLNVLCDP
ncbi:hypothetical protein GPECTOR_22g855 [Gonium pectorale]|uniref:Uncharacterized protein n=1 Tax=Gonium pectorale TaxID=33097 RepID=A0A150GHD6_GONPE|nr:hypothetical protein GPECTOR_22g855 [Gonium pectorale]|eukprot:KXZ49262.1 hypothetical protein GPECTOR_22g855 [Gonium pectorale]